jgi:hypothetical protein
MRKTFYEDLRGCVDEDEEAEKRLIESIDIEARKNYTKKCTDCPDEASEECEICKSPLCIECHFIQRHLCAACWVDLETRKI